jgi:hypothetical protein
MTQTLYAHMNKKNKIKKNYSGYCVGNRCQKDKGKN